MRTTEVSQTCRFCGETFSPAGIRNHEQWCDENPKRGVRPDAMGGSANPLGDQTSDSGGSLPPRKTLGGEQSPTDSHSQAPGDECPLCGHDGVIDASEARERLREQADGDLPERADTALALTSYYCTDPECGAVWTDPDEAVTMQEVMET